MKRQFLISAALIAAAFSSFSHALPIVTYTVSGTDGNYLIDFSLENTIDASYDQTLYFFGVNLPTSADQSAPEGWENYGPGYFNTDSWGGSDIDYRSVWITEYSGTEYPIESGESLSGFIVSSAVLPAEIRFYAFGTGGSDYFEIDAFNQGFNPGFEGIVGLETSGSTSVPEPASLAMFGLGLAGLGLSRRKRFIKK